MREFQEALALATKLAADHRVGTERVDLLDAFRRVLAEDVVADIDIPPFPQSTRDGFACRRADLGKDLEVVETIAAGNAPQRSLGPNQCAKVMTGAALPAGADCVVMLEHVARLTDASIRCPPCYPQDHICPQGAHVIAGETILRAGEMIEAPHIAVLAGAGCSRPLVSRRPTVGVIATGSELVEPDRKPGPCRIRNSNSFQLSAMALAASAVPRNYGLVADDSDAIQAALRKATTDNDVVILSGGISKGDYDLVRGILEANLDRVLFDRIGPAPGRPVIFGVSGGVFCFGLSGNPVSNFVMFELMVKPFLHALAGHRFQPITSHGQLVGAIRRRKVDKELWLPVTISEDGRVHLVEDGRSTGMIAMCRADGLVHVPPGVADIAEGTMVTVRRL